MKKYAPEFLGVALALLCLNLWYFSSFAIENKVLPVGYNIFKDVVAPAIGALSGAYFAFMLSRRKEEDEKVLLEAKKLNQILIHLVLQLNALANIKEQLDRHKNIHDLAFNLRAEKNYNENITFDIADITLILSDNPQLLLELSVEQDGFISTIESHKVRMEFFLRVLHPIAIDKGLVNRFVNIGEYKAELPFHIFKAAYDSVNVLKTNLLDSEQGLHVIFTKFRAECVGRFPNHRFCNLDA